MALTPGTRIGSYEITAQIGVGGMGEVYRATDTKLKRDVAIKVLPDALATDTQRLARFQREAEVLASLNHPNIAAIHGLEDAGGSKALILELVEGPTLADRIAEGPIPVDEALPIATQIAEALEAAHEQGIVHRDLKPANVKVRPDGTVKVLDFGLAKAMEPMGGPSSSLSMSPTITTPAMTQAGLILGTAAYMSPEQAKGKPADRRSDIWAFGCVLYEMLTGHRAFQAEDVSETLAAVLRAEVNWSLLPRVVPPAVRVFLESCVQKDPRRRLGDMQDMRLALDGAFDAAVPGYSQASSPSQRMLPLAAALVVGGLMASAAMWLVTRPGPLQPLQFEVVTPPEGRPGSEFYSDVAISPDGTKVVYGSGTGTESRLYIRSMDQLEVTLLRGAAPASNPFFSPDGGEVGFIDPIQNAVKRVSVFGGQATTIATMSTVGGGISGASWGPNGLIVVGRQTGGLWQIPENGGDPEALTTTGVAGQSPAFPAPGGAHRFPFVLPNGKGVLFTIVGADVPSLGVVSLEDGSVSELTAGSGPRYAATGHIIYGLAGTLQAVGFDQDRLELTGTRPVPVLERVWTKANGATVFALADNGSLAYLEGAGGGVVSRELVWVNRQGQPQLVDTVPSGPYERVRLSPDGSQVLLLGDVGAGDAWVYRLADGRQTRITDDGLTDAYGVWDPDGTRVAYTSSREEGGQDIWVEPVDKSGPPERLVDTEDDLDLDGWSPDGHVLAFHNHKLAGGQPNLLTMNLDEPSAEPRVFQESDQVRMEATVFSPDSRYVAYVSNESGQAEVYVRPFPGPGSQYTASVGGGEEPVWGANGELFYRSLGGGARMMSVKVETTPTLTMEPPVQVFEGTFVGNVGGGWSARYDVAADGQRFLMLRDPGEGAAPRRLVYVEHWLDESKRLVLTD